MNEHNVSGKQLIQFFKSSQKEKKELSIEFCGIRVKRKFRAVSYGAIDGKYYYILREQIYNLIEYVIVFDKDNYIRVNAISEKPFFFKITSIILHIAGDQKEALTALIRYIIAERYVQGARGLNGGFNIVECDKIILEVLGAWNFYSVPVPIISKNFYSSTLYFSPLGSSVFEGLMAGLGLAYMRGNIVDICILADQAYGFIRAVKKKYYNIYHYEIKAERGCVAVELNIKFRGRKKFFEIDVIMFNGFQPLLFQHIILKIVFDCIHGNLRGGIKHIECKVDNDLCGLVKPGFEFLGGNHTENASGHYFTLSF